MKAFRTWVESGNTLCLDLRKKIDFTACHLKRSTNIPLSQLELRQSELPPKRLPFAVLEPLDSKGCASWLTEHGWQVPWVFWEGQLEWNDMTPWIAPKTEEKKWLLFQASPFLQKQIKAIEESLPQDRPWQFLDIGCGSGRDVGYILARGKQWQGSAFDSMPGALIRTDALVKNLQVAQKVRALAQARLMHNGQWKLISSAWLDNMRTTGVEDIDEKMKRLDMSKLENGRPEELSFSELYDSILPANATDRSNKFDLVLNVRFLSRPFLHLVPELLNIGGYFLISHFLHDGVHEYQHPKRTSRLELNEISDLFNSMENMEIVTDAIEESEDGRPMNSVLVRRIA